MTRRTGFEIHMPVKILINNHEANYVPYAVRSSARAPGGVVGATHHTEETMRLHLAGIIFAVIFLSTFSIRNIFALDNASVEKKIAAKDTSVAVETEKYVPEVIIHAEWGAKLGEFGLGEPLGEWMDSYQTPTDFAVDVNGNIFVMDPANNRVQKFNSDGKVLEAYPLNIFVPATPADYQVSIKTWNTSKPPQEFAKIQTNGLVYIGGKLYVHQQTMSDVKINQYVDQILVLASSGFVAASAKETEIYKEAGVGDKVDENGDRSRKSPDGKWEKYKKNETAFDIADNSGNRYAEKNGIWRKLNKNGNKIFEFKTIKRVGSGKTGWVSKSKLHFSRNGKTFYEMKVFSSDGMVPFQDNGGGIEIVKWVKK